MKKILSLLGTITLIGTSTASLVACDKIYEYTPEELKELKEKNKINTKNQEIRDNLEWMASQEKPFKDINNKYFYVISRNSLKSKWNVFKLKNNGKKGSGKKTDWGDRNVGFIFTSDGIYLATGNLLDTSVEYAWGKDKKSENYIKAVYRWNLTTPEPDLVIDTNGNVKVKGE